MGAIQPAPGWLAESIIADFAQDRSAVGSSGAASLLALTGAASGKPPPVGGAARTAPHLAAGGVGLPQRRAGGGLCGSGLRPDRRRPHAARRGERPAAGRSGSGGDCARLALDCARLGVKRGHLPAAVVIGRAQALGRAERLPDPDPVPSPQPDPVADDQPVPASSPGTSAAGEPTKSPSPKPSKSPSASASSPSASASPSASSAPSATAPSSSPSLRRSPSPAVLCPGAYSSAPTAPASSAPAPTTPAPAAPASTAPASTAPVYGSGVLRLRRCGSGVYGVHRHKRAAPSRRGRRRPDNGRARPG